MIRHIDHEMLRQKVKQHREDETKEMEASGQIPAFSLSRTSLTINKANSPKEIEEDLKMEDQCYILGYLALNHTTSPKHNIPYVTTPCCEDLHFQVLPTFSRDF